MDQKGSIYTVSQVVPEPRDLKVDGRLVGKQKEENGGEDEEKGGEEEVPKVKKIEETRNIPGPGGERNGLRSWRGGR